MRLGMQKVEPGPSGEIHRKESGEGIEAHDEARRPAPAQHEQLEAAREVILQADKQPRRRSRGGRCRRGNRMIR
jgi:hypothetical protein